MSQVRVFEPMSPSLLSPPRAKATSCGSLLQELQDLWDEIGETDAERDRMILQLEQECLNVYRKKVDNARKNKADLHQALASGKAEISHLMSALGECESIGQLENKRGTLKEQVAMIKPLLDALRNKKEERIKELMLLQSQITLLSTEMAGNVHPTRPTQVDEHDLSVKKLSELSSQLEMLQKEKDIRLRKVNEYVASIHELTNVMSLDLSKTLSEIHPGFNDGRKSISRSISNDTLTRLEATVNALKQEKKERLQKLQGHGSALVELWNIIDMPSDERSKFEHITRLISVSPDAVFGQGRLGPAVIDEAREEVERLNLLKASKMKELVLKKQDELEEIYREVHMDIESEAERQILMDLIDSGTVDLSDLLAGMDGRIVKAKEQAISRKDILEKVEKWKFASEEESWLDEYERDQSRYSAGRGVHKNMKRAEKARILVNKLPVLVETLMSKIKAWEKEKGIPFEYDKVKLLDTLEEYIRFRMQKDEEKKRSREQKKLQEQLMAEKETMFGAKPSPLRQFPVKKPLGQSSNVNVVTGTPASRRISTSRHGGASSGKGRKELGGKAANAAIPLNFVSLPKDNYSNQSP
ncbi:Microtubule-associated protein 65-5 [Rhynchospora pubera]|uniref:Microtubule-associated protein 65-5 n=1 Tax=Rhynchospora pubera TaxID=906938 RepID=A0AAV8GK69_9POAL|nr:Microtubule-associated protein 65-5 [Rhynchospora pubera]